MANAREVFILSSDPGETKKLCSILSKVRFKSKIFNRIDDLEAALNRSDNVAVIIDVDSVLMTNRTIRLLKGNFPKLNIFCTSRRRLHPELQEALSQHIRASLTKPVDPDELQFWLTSISENGVNSKRVSE